jgi:outer membrane protein, multidrug efflux system
MPHPRPTLSRILLSAAVSGLALAGIVGCTVVPPPTSAAVLDEALPANAKPPARWSNPTDAAAVSTGWVAGFHDKRLTALVSEALANNNDLKIAAARVEEARQALVIAGSPLFPAVGIGASGDAGRDLSTGDSFGHSGAVLSAEWEADVWGKISSGKAAAFAQAEAAAQTEAYARLSIAGLVARGWYTNIGLRQQIAVAREQVQTYTEQSELVQKKFAAGAVDMLDVDQANAAVSAAEASLVLLQSRSQTALRSLEVLLGRYPGNRLDISAGFPALPAQVPAGTPAALISRRPDVVAAAQQVDAAFYEIQVAQLSLLPAFTLTGRGGRLNDDVLSVLGLAPDYLLLGASILQPIFEGGALNADIASATARQQAAVAAYGQSLLTAFREVETALSNESYFRQRLGHLQDENVDLLDAVKLGQDKFTAGQISMQNLLQIQQRQEAVEQQVIEAQTGVVINRVDLYLALGGSL